VRDTAAKMLNGSDSKLFRHRGFTFRFDGPYSPVWDDQNIVHGIWYKDRNSVNDSKCHLIAIAEAGKEGFTILVSDFRATVSGVINGVENLQNPKGAILWFESTKELFGD
jgi:hypothetical protein